MRGYTLATWEKRSSLFVGDLAERGHQGGGQGQGRRRRQAAAPPCPNLVNVCNNLGRRSVFAESRTQTAFRWSVMDLFERGRTVYFWTFTMVDAIPSWQFGTTWTRLLVDLQTCFGKLRGVRVFEWHRNHGLHCHALIDERLNVNVVRRCAKRYGFGRLHVEVANIGAALYLAKYLDKDRGRIPYSGRSWARLGNNGPRVNQVKFESAKAGYMKGRIAMLRQDGMKASKAWAVAEHEWEHAWYKEALAKLGGIPPEVETYDGPENPGDPF